MKVIVKDFLNVRVGSPSVNAPCYQYIAPGSELTVEDALYYGDEYEGSSKWLRDGAGNYYWAGGVRESKNTIHPISDELIFNPLKMTWGINGGAGLDLLTIWNEHKLRGQNVRVAVLDTGINSSIPDIYDAIADKEHDLKSFLDNSSIEDDDGHGTRCASILASRGYTIYGAAPQCELIIGKIRSRAVPISTINLLNALKWACEERDADIISMSFNSPSLDPLVQDYIKKAHLEMNKIFVASIGNAGKYARNANTYPANYIGCLSVGAHGKGRISCNISSWNNSLSFSAPGDELLGFNLSGEKEILSPATSYACPFAAGAIATILSYYKTSGKQYVAKDIYSILQYNNPSISGADLRLQYGKGIINPLQTLKHLS